ncbi:alpha/beta hydrolase [Nostoc flagelliforme FACHB-838]|uniref:Alpha/beta hydrolase n=1 Tax=Nostoc flagelliforme FACHB-838 TaxID=2692904 RepID=A0ABR8DNU2_9NOSO|nr:alpha/beta hydrolase [Nostoc flagelliforme]MBD2531112.1 alpha/beta hydrolase [Nostoc flagelliforme FACHB-838]
MAHIISKQTVWLLRFFIVGLLPALAANQAVSAERIKFNYGVLERSISISSLETYARTGKMDEDFAVYSQYIDKKQLTQLRQSLLTPINLNQVGVSKYFALASGEVASQLKS